MLYKDNDIYDACFPAGSLACW